MTTSSPTMPWAAIISTTAQTIHSSPSKSYATPSSVPQTIDHTLLKLDATSSQIDTLCAEAKRDDFASVCVRPNWVKQCVANLKGTKVKVAAVVGFHEGTYTLEEKLRDVQESIEGGAQELDVVVNWGELKNGEYEKIFSELFAIRSAARAPILQKLILETSQLSDDEIVAGAVLAHVSGFDYIKTATGFHGHGATVPHVQLMKTCCEVLANNTTLQRQGGGEGEMKVKASGGVRSFEDAVKMLEAGASRLGTSGGVLIAKQAKEGGKVGGGSGAKGGEEY